MKEGVILVGTNGWAELRPSLTFEERNKALAYHKAWWKGVRFFHSDGFLYEIESAEPERPLGMLSKVLAHALYNPWLKFQYKYRKLGSYSTTDLRAAIARAIQEDDDVLTQFANREELLQKLADANDFRAISAVITRGTRGHSDG